MNLPLAAAQDGKSKQVPLAKAPPLGMGEGGELDPYVFSKMGAAFAAQAELAQPGRPVYRCGGNAMWVNMRLLAVPNVPLSECSWLHLPGGRAGSGWRPSRGVGVAGVGQQGARERRWGRERGGGAASVSGQETDRQLGGALLPETGPLARGHWRSRHVRRHRPPQLEA